MATIDAQLTTEHYLLGEIIWKYLRVRHEKPAWMLKNPGDLIIMVLGSPDLAVADHAADLLKRGVAEYAVISGGQRLSEGLEADVIAELMEKKSGIEPKKLIREQLSLNTSDHFIRTEELLRDRPEIASGENPPKYVVLVPTPVAERRAFATGRLRWKNSYFWVDGIPESYDDYMGRREGTDALSRMVGEVERILTYPRLKSPYMADPDELVTDEVKAAYDELRHDFNGRPVPGRSTMGLSLSV